MLRMTTLAMAALGVALLVGLPGCSKEEEGTMEKAGKEADAAATQASDKMGEAAKEVGDEVEKAVGDDK